MFKFLATVIVLLAAIGAVWYTGWLTKWVPSIPSPDSLFSSKAPVTATTTQQTPTEQQPAAVNDLPTSQTDASDQALAQDSAALDVQMEALTTDSANAQGSLNDKPVTQEY
jgi:hypothetical protein